MTRTIRKLNEVNAYRQKIIALEIADVELFRENILLQNKYHILHNQKTKKKLKTFNHYFLLEEAFNHILVK